MRRAGQVHRGRAAEAFQGRSVSALEDAGGTVALGIGFGGEPEGSAGPRLLKESARPTCPDRMVPGNGRRNGRG